MTIRQDESKEIVLESVERFSDKAEIRKFLLCTFILEECKTKLRYYVETLSDGKRIYIERPGKLNKGCDFIIYVEDLLKYKNMNDKPPKHDDLLNDLRVKQSFLSKEDFNKVLLSIKDIYELRPFLNAYSKVKDINCIGWSFELLLKLCRWFFIEQDITYWAHSGRDMLYTEIRKLKND
ncbi:MAG: hypothetical protein SOR57_05225 [Parabacteroides sp.]|nr:hypothetical protein [Parabacteroides sp.]